MDCSDFDEVCTQKLDVNNEVLSMECLEEYPVGCHVAGKNEDGKITRCSCEEDKCNWKNLKTGQTAINLKQMMLQVQEMLSKMEQNNGTQPN